MFKLSTSCFIFISLVSPSSKSTVSTIARFLTYPSKGNSTSDRTKRNCSSVIVPSGELLNSYSKSLSFLLPNLAFSIYVAKKVKNPRINEQK